MYIHRPHQIFLSSFRNSSDIEQIAMQLCANEPILNEDYLPELKTSLRKLQKRLKAPVKNKFYHFKSLRSNILPLTNVAFNKEGSRCLHIYMNTWKCGEFSFIMKLSLFQLCDWKLWPNRSHLGCWQWNGIACASGTSKCCFWGWI